MELKATLNSPYTDVQKCDFIVEQNHKNGYEIRYTETAIEAWGLTAEEMAEKEKQAQKRDLISQLDQIDLKCIRALRALQAGTGTEADTAKLAELEEQAGDIRQQIQELGE